MATGYVKTTDGKKSMLYRAYTENGSLSSTQYLPPTQFKVGINNGTPSISSTDIDNAIPILNGTVNDDCNTTFTGSNGGTTTTNNTTVYKEGGGVTDNTAQNLLTTGSNVTKTWTKTTLDNNFTATRYAGFWLYIKDSTALAKFLTSGTALEVRFRSDASNYYAKTWTAADLAVGWNWLPTGIINTLTATGTPGTLDEFMIQITTNNAADAFVAGDVVLDLVRTWQFSDTVQDFVAGYPALDYTKMEATMRCYLPTTVANGFDISGVGIVNEDTTRLLMSEATTTSESKSALDEFVYIFKERIL